MCQHCEFHRTRATQQRALAARADSGTRGAHSALADLHDARLAEYRAQHAEPAL